MHNPTHLRSHVQTASAAIARVLEPRREVADTGHRSRQPIANGLQKQQA